LKGLPAGFMIQEDNVALEFNIPVCYNKSEFSNAFSVMREKTTDILSNLGYTLSPNASMSFAKEELTHPKALVFGCEPDYNAWSRKENQKPRSTDENLRTCGGHIHVGTKVDMLKGTQNMDLFLGVPSVLLDDSPSSIARRELYGKAGAMRPKPYGFEYRVLSNYWMFHDKLVRWVYDQTFLAMYYESKIKHSKEIQECINTGDKELAKHICSTYNIKLPVM
jgi:hypothetical protein